MKHAKQVLFLLLSSAILVFFSEKTFWYIQGYKLAPIILYYLIPTFFFLWSLQNYSADNLFSLFLGGALFGFITEGVLTTTLYEDGYFHLMSISYTSLGWHAIFSTTFGWYFLHKWLIKRDIKKIVRFSIVTWIIFVVAYGCQAVCPCYKYRQCTRYERYAGYGRQRRLKLFQLVAVCFTVKI